MTWFVLLAMVALFAPFFFLTPQKQVRVDGKPVTYEVVSSVADRAKGLSNRDSLPRDQGMIFVFEQVNSHCFWMKDTRFDIDIMWLDTERKVVDMKTMTPESFPENFCPKNPAKYAVEVNAGVLKEADVQIGQTISLSPRKP